MAKWFGRSAQAYRQNLLNHVIILWALDYGLTKICKLVDWRAEPGSDLFERARWPTLGEDIFLLQDTLHPSLTLGTPPQGGPTKWLAPSGGSAPSTGLPSAEVLPEGDILT
jgi:hypothetical protein